MKALDCFSISSGVRLRRLDDQMVVYVTDRFETHLLDENGCELLEAVCQMHAVGETCSVSAVYAFLTGESTAASVAEVEEKDALNQLLSELVRIGVFST